MWFEELTGFKEESPNQVHMNMTVDGEILRSNINGKEYICGQLERPRLDGLRRRVRSSQLPSGIISVREEVANVQYLHANAENVGSLFQVASQFNLLEMTGPLVTPERGVGIYEHDYTQGPSCAIAAGAGTIYRNYFAIVNGQIGQSANNQIDCLSDIGEALGNTEQHLWRMSNGYALASEDGLVEISGRLASSSESELDILRGLLRIGVQWNTEVTISGCEHTVSQAYCSALPVAYSNFSPKLWEAFARLILEACYEATICTGIMNYISSGNNKLYLTLIGGGVFGNESEWIMSAIQRAINLYRHVGLDVVIVSYGHSNKDVQRLIGQYNCAPY